MDYFVCINLTITFGYTGTLKVARQYVYIKNGNKISERFSVFQLIYLAFQTAALLFPPALSSVVFRQTKLASW